jgi:hypothetical protein
MMKRDEVKRRQSQKSSKRKGKKTEGRRGEQKKINNYSCRVIKKRKKQFHNCSVNYFSFTCLFLLQ